VWALLGEWKAKIYRLKGKAEHATADARMEHNRQIDDL